jgi:hypothetical protein
LASSPLASAGEAARGVGLKGREYLSLSSVRGTYKIGPEYCIQFLAKKTSLYYQKYSSSYKIINEINIAF